MCRVEPNQKIFGGNCILGQKRHRLQNPAGEFRLQCSSIDDSEMLVASIRIVVFKISDGENGGAFCSALEIDHRPACYEFCLIIFGRQCEQGAFTGREAALALPVLQFRPETGFGKIHSPSGIIFLISVNMVAENVRQPGKSVFRTGPDIFGGRIGCTGGKARGRNLAPDYVSGFPEEMNIILGTAFETFKVGELWIRGTPMITPELTQDIRFVPDLPFRHPVPEMSGDGPRVVEKTSHRLFAMVERNFTDVAANASGENSLAGTPADFLIFRDRRVQRIPVAETEPGADSPLRQGVHDVIEP